MPWHVSISVANTEIMNFKPDSSVLGKKIIVFISCLHYPNTKRLENQTLQKYIVQYVCLLVITFWLSINYCIYTMFNGSVKGIKNVLPD